MNPTPQEQLRRQLRFLETSARLYDDGQEDEALRIAVALRVLFHQTGNSHSIITQLGATGTLKLLSTFSERPAVKDGKRLALWIEFPMFIDGFEPQLATSQHERFLPFETWWTDIVYTHDRDYSRSEITLAAANKDGGAHVDPRPSEIIDELRSGLGTFTSYHRHGLETHVTTNAHFPFLRQLAHEVLNSPDLHALAT